jgi:poly(hydroxyalkanoate) depolymerase family esterase
MGASAMGLVFSLLVAFEPRTAQSSSLEQVANFGPNPGNLIMNRHVPASLPPAPALVVALHACEQTAADYVNAGWNQLADAYGFLVLYPEQQTANNSLRCFNWSWDPSSPAGLTRGQGENESIKEMVDRMKADFPVDPQRVFVTGFSAGGAEAIELLALWPDVFAAGASFAGVPYECAATLSDAQSCLSGQTTKSASAWGDLVRQAYAGYAGPWPRLSIWQGTTDPVVSPLNVAELVKQWTNVHAIDAVPDESDTVGPLAHQAYQDGAGHTLVETFQVANIDHAVPIDPMHACGANGTYFVDDGLCSTFKIAASFGLIPAAAADAGVPPLDGAAPDASGANPDLPPVPSSGELGDPPGSTPPGSSGCTASPGAPSGPSWLVVCLVLGVARRRSRTSAST